MSYSWISGEFLAGPAGFCDVERVTGPFFPSETLAELHAKANVERESRRVAHVRTPTNQYTITEGSTEVKLFENIYVRIVGLRYHEKLPSFPKEIKFEHEDENQFDNQAVLAIADGIKVGYLTREDARFFRELESTGIPIKEVYVKRRENSYYDLGIEMD
jgi:hypothetical protein